MWFTKYLWIPFLLILLGGIFESRIGLFVAVIMGTLFVTSIFRGRWFCGNLCPRGSFNDNILSKISRHKKIPKILRNMVLRSIIFILMMGFMFYRLINTQGIVELIGSAFIFMCILTTVFTLFFGTVYSPRAWCTFCPMGTMQKIIGAKKMKLNFDSTTCINCGICESVCPMQLEVRNIDVQGDCIKCSRCVVACPKKSLNF